MNLIYIQITDISFCSLLCWTLLDMEPINLNYCCFHDLNCPQNPMTGVVKETFETPYTKEHRLGGREAGKGLKYFGCFVLNSCQKYGKDFFYEPLNAYRCCLMIMIILSFL